MCLCFMLLAVAELEFYKWGGQGLAEANSGGDRMTENQCITLTCQNKSYNC